MPTIARLSTQDATFDADLARLLDRAPEQDPKVSEATARIVADVRARGDAALLEATNRFDGSAWTQLTTTTTENFRGVWGSGAGDVWAVSSHEPSIGVIQGAIHHYDGTAWTQVGGQREELTLQAKDHAVAVRLCLQQLTDKKCLQSPKELAAIGFKAVHAQHVTGVERVDERVLQAMEAYNDVAPAHNPPYVTAMRLLNKPVYDVHVPLDRERLRDAHVEAGLRVVSCDYHLFTHFGICNVDDVQGPSRHVKRAAHRALVDFSRVIWRLETMTRPFKPTPWLSGYVVAVAERPER